MNKSGEKGKTVRYHKGMNQRITIDPKVCHGKPCIRGTRIMVSNILSLMAGGYSAPKILKNYPELTAEDIKAALEYAGEVVRDEEILQTV